MSDWNLARELYERLNNTYPKHSQPDFLCSGASGDKLAECKTHRNSFVACLKLFKSGILEKNYLTWHKSQKYTPIENKRIFYVTSFFHSYKRYKVGLSFLRMHSNFLKWIQEAGLGNFKFSNGYISDILRLYGKNMVHIHGEGNDVT